MVKLRPIKNKDNRLKLNLIKQRACTDCDLYYPPEAMDFDHINPENKIANISYLVRTVGIRKTILEAKKCEIVCSNCHIIRTKKRNSKVKKRLRNIKARRAVNKIKDCPCKDCGDKYPHYIMQFDHRTPSRKIADISTMVKKNLDIKLIKMEIRKCDVVCSNCHRIRTKRRARKKR